MQRMNRLMTIATLFASTLAMAQTDNPIKPLEGRFDLDAPLPTLPALKLETGYNAIGVAQQTAKSKGVQARILWVDATANLDRVNSVAKIQSLVRTVKSAGFNTIVFDVKPIVGYTLYPSKLTDKLTKWKGQTLPMDFDPLKAMVAACKAEAIPLYASMNTFSEGHRSVVLDPNGRDLFGLPGPGYERPEDQTVLYEPEPVLSLVWGGPEYPVVAEPNKLDPSGQKLAVFTRVSAPRTAPAGAYGVIVDGDGIVLMAVTGENWSFPGIPEGGSLILGQGAAADYLRANLGGGARVRFKSIPKFVKISERPDQQIPLMLNPHKQSVRERVWSFAEEIAENYDVAGVVFDDRLRYGNLNADFSPEARAGFEAFVGQQINWPNDVFELSFNLDLTKGMRAGRFFDAWWAWRAQQMTDWVAEAKRRVAKARPGTQLGVYAGSWFGEYWRYGNNYASRHFQAGFTFLNDQYRKTGFAQDIDFLMTGCYYPTATVYDALSRNLPAGRTVEAAGQLSNRAVRDETWVYAGIELMKFKGRPNALMDALQAACGATQGVMVFDLSHDIEQFWPIFKRAFAQPKVAPHAVAGLLDEVRQRRASIDATGVRDYPVVIREGAAGTGM